MDYHVENDNQKGGEYMAAGLILKESSIQSSQLEDVKEYIQFLKTLDEDEKREFRGIIRGMQAMKDMMRGNAN